MLSSADLLVDHLPVFQLAIMTDDMDLAGDIIQALAQFLNVEDLLTTADFPVEIEALKQILFKVWWSQVESLNQGSFSQNESFCWYLL